MKILFINYECPPLGGGGGVATFQLAAELAKRHEVDYLTMGYYNLPPSENVDQVHIIRVPVIDRKKISTATYISLISFVPFAFLKGVILCNKRKYDCIHAFFIVPSGICAFLLSRIFHIPLILTALGGDVYDPSKRHSPHNSCLMKRVISFLLNHSDKNTVESLNLRDLILQYYPINKPLQVVPLGFNKPVFPLKSRLDLNMPENKIVFISVGRLVKRKGFEYSIQALSRISGYSFHYFILGEGPDERNLKKLVLQLGMTDKITFLGHVTEEMKFQYLNVADIYLLPSLHEGFGICLLEAMHCGLPIVSTNNGGQEDIIKDRRNALFADPADSAMFAERIVELLENSDLRNFISHKNRRDIAGFYVDEIVHKYESLYTNEERSRRIEHES